MLHYLPALEYHTNLHHSQTRHGVASPLFSLSTILIYIILKPSTVSVYHPASLSTILIYIILKRSGSYSQERDGLSTILIYIILKLRGAIDRERLWLEYHTNLHHSQTTNRHFTPSAKLEYHTNLHHSQTVPICTKNRG